jgi:hypothetical protein
LIRFGWIFKNERIHPDILLFFASSRLAGHYSPFQKTERYVLLYSL